MDWKDGLTAAAIVGVGLFGVKTIRDTQYRNYLVNKFGDRNAESYSAELGFKCKFCGSSAEGLDTWDDDYCSRACEKGLTVCGISDGKGQNGSYGEFCDIQYRGKSDADDNKIIIHIGCPNCEFSEDGWGMSFNQEMKEGYRAEAEEFDVIAGRGFQIEFSNGYRVSVMFGLGNYGDHHRVRDKIWAEHSNNPPPRWTSRRAEIAVFNPDGDFFLPDQVIGWVSPAFVSEMLGLAAKGDEEGMKELGRNSHLYEAESFSAEWDEDGYAEKQARFLRRLVEDAMRNGCWTKQEGMEIMDEARGLGMSIVESDYFRNRDAETFEGESDEETARRMEKNLGIPYDVALRMNKSISKGLEGWPCKAHRIQYCDKCCKAHRRQNCDECTTPSEAETHAYSYAYNEGHSDSRKREEYRPNLSSARQESDFKKILKQKGD